MKICYLSGVNSPHTIKWCKYFAEKGHDVHLISFDPGSIDGVKVHHIDLGVTSNSSRLKKIKYIFSSKKIKNVINEVNPDIIHAHRATGYAYIASKINTSPYILSVWGSDVYDLPENPIYRYFIRMNLKRADYVFSTSHAMKDQVQTLIKKDVIVTPFGVDLCKFRPIDGLRNENKIVIGTIKTLSPKYGIEYLINAFKIIKDRNPDIKLELHIGGKGPQEDYLKKTCKNLNIENEVLFLGYLTQEEVIESFNSFHIAVFPSILNSESFGVAAVEAQACGVPVVVSNVGGLPEATEPGVTSLLVEKKNEGQLADAIEQLVRNEKLRNEMSMRARIFVEDKYDLDNNFGEVEKIYEKIIKANEAKGNAEI